MESYDPDTTPAGIPPPGVTPNLIDPVSLQSATIGIFVTLMALATLAVIARIFGSIGGLGIHDVFSVLALIFSVIQSAIVLSISRTERHQWDIPLAWYDDTYFKRVFTQDILAWPAIFFAKLAILYLYKKIFGIKDYMQTCIWVGFIWTVVTYLPNIFVASYYCAPHIGEQWSLLIGENCGNPSALKWEIASAGMSILLDLFILVIPIPAIIELQLTTKKRLAVLAVFLTAVLAVVCAILTLVFRIQIFLNQNGDPAWETAQLYICNGAENYTAIIVGCVPGLYSFRRYVAESRLYTTITESLLSRGTRMRASTENTPSGSSSRSKTKRQFGGSLFDTEVVDDQSSQTNLREYHELNEGIRYQ